MLAGARVEVSPEKRNPVDFALWKKAEPNHIMQWPSPWGMGYPGWHLECSAMSMKYLGQPFDIHGGGMENKFPHHECEIAQSEAARGVPFVRNWVHNNMVTVDGQKMGKSLGNFITLKEAFAGDAREAVAGLRAAGGPAARSQQPLPQPAGLLRRRPVRRPQRVSEDQRGRPSPAKADRHRHRRASRIRVFSSSLRRPRPSSKQAMNDDLNTSVALSVLFDLVRLTNSLLENRKTTRETLAAVNEVFTKLGGDVLGIVTEEPAQAGGVR